MVYNKELVTDLVIEGFSIEEAEDWIQGAIKHKGKLGDDLDLKPGQKLYDLSPSKIVSYAKQSTENMKRVIFARTLARSRPGSKTSAELDFWNEVSKELNAA